MVMCGLGQRGRGAAVVMIAVMAFAPVAPQCFAGEPVAPLVGPPASLAGTDAQVRERQQPLGPKRAADSVAPTSTSTLAPSEGASWLERIGTIGFPLLIVLSMVVLMALAFRKLARMGGGVAGALGAGGKSPSGIVEVLGRYPIARGQTLVLLKVDRRVLVLNHSLPSKHHAGGFATLSQFDDATDVASILMKVSEAEGLALSNQFDGALQTATTAAERVEQRVEQPLVDRRAVVGVEGGAGDRSGRADRAELWSDRGELLRDVAQRPAVDEPSLTSLRAKLSSLRGRAVADGGVR